MSKQILKWNFIFQYGWVLTNIFNSIVLLPFYLKNIDASTLGVWLATGNILGWMTLVDPGVGEVLQQKIAEIRGKGEQNETGKLIASGFIASVMIFIGSIILGGICYFFIGSIINKDIHQYSNLPLALLVSILATAMTLVSFSISGINQGMHNSAHVAVCSISANFLFLFINIFLLYVGWGVLSIAVANLCRAIYINFFNIFSLLRLTNRENYRIKLDWTHFRQFVRIFSVTSASKIITGLSYSVDMIVLARYLPPASITMYEINKRPINVTYSLIGRHSVALMPLISHAKGKGDRGFILNLVNKQFRVYCYAALLACFLFYFNYENLVTAWTGNNHYAGSFIINLMIAGFFTSLVSYFLAIVGYALGDIRMNSIYNIIRNIFFGLLMFLAARNYGIPGTLIVSVCVTLIADLLFYSWRLKKMGYLDLLLWQDIFSRWIFVLPAGFSAGIFLQFITPLFIPANFLFVRLIINGGFFVIFYGAIVLMSDNVLRQSLSHFVANTVSKFSLKKVSA